MRLNQEQTAVLTEGRGVALALQAAGIRAVVAEPPAAPAVFTQRAASKKEMTPSELKQSLETKGFTVTIRGLDQDNI